MTRDEIQNYLSSVIGRSAKPSKKSVEMELANLKQKAIARADQDEAKALWCLEQSLKVQELYIEAFKKMKNGQFYRAWCDFEQAEMTLHFLEKHNLTDWSHFHLNFIQEYIEKWQSLFPYKIFMSPEILELEKVCTICRQVISIRKPCGHRVGEIYNGEMCCREVTKMEVPSISFVKNPAQKYSVGFLPDPKTGKIHDHYNYEVVKYAVSALNSPFDRWDVTKTKRRQPHSRFRSVGRNNPCPCESGKKYKNCCLKQDGVLRPHLEFYFNVTLPPDFPTELYID